MSSITVAGGAVNNIALRASHWRSVCQYKVHGPAARPIALGICRSGERAWLCSTTNRIGGLSVSTKCMALQHDQSLVVEQPPLAEGQNCVIVSLGSRGEYEFEQAMLDKTSCDIWTFDCSFDGDSLDGVRCGEGVGLWGFQARGPGLNPLRMR
jgi:Methyltransferase domain